MVCLVFPDDTDWYVANWVFRVFAESVKHQYPADLELAEILDAGLGAGGLFLSKLRSDLLERTMASLDEVVRKTLSGELTDWLAELEDEPGRKSGYLTGVDRLRQAIEDYEIGGKSGGRE